MLVKHILGVAIGVRLVSERRHLFFGPPGGCLLSCGGEWLGAALGLEVALSDAIVLRAHGMWEPCGLRRVMATKLLLHHLLKELLVRRAHIVGFREAVDQLQAQTVLLAACAWLCYGHVGYDGGCVLDQVRALVELGVGRGGARLVPDT